MRITVFTPTYNRVHTLERLYHSLQRQTFTDFEWIVVDDGSTDGTEQIFDTWIQEDNSFTIIYKKVENGGKHRAINKAVQMAQGEMFFIADSDDYLTDDCLQVVDFIENSIPLKKKHLFAGICGQDGYNLTTLVGTSFQGQDYLDITSLEREKYGIFGDKKEVFYTEILKEFPFPEYENEKFVSECIVWNKIARSGYLLRFFNQIIYIIEYQQDGLSNCLDDILRQSPKGWAALVLDKKESQIFKTYYNALMWYYRVMRKEICFSDICNNLQISRIKMLLYVLIYQLNWITARIFGRIKRLIGRLAR